MNNKEIIDIVIPWVDPTDKKWQTEKNKYLPKKEEAAEENNQEKFFRDWDTLKYLFRSIERNMPWINKIHFLTYGHLPSWLKEVLMIMNNYLLIICI